MLGLLPLRVRLGDAPDGVACTARETRAQRFLRVLRALIVGAWATVVDLGVLTLCVRGLGIEPTLGRGIALVASCLVLFFGSRSFAFHAQAGSVSRQAKLFVLGELLALPLNLSCFYLLALHLPLVAPEIVSQVASFLVFWAFSYPVRSLIVFRVPVPRAA